MATKKVGDLIKEARTNARLSQEALAKKIDGLSASDLGKAERGEKELTQALLKEIAKATGVTQKSLLEAPKGASAKKTTAAKTAEKKTTAKKTAAKKTGAASETLTAAEKKLLELYRAADADTKKAAVALLKGEQPLNGAMAVFGKNLTFYPHCILKMAWFKGKDKTTFLDNRLVSGNIIELQSEAMAFCFKHLNLSGVVKGLYREEELEVPVEALREAIINALAHRLYSSNGGVSLAIFEDRVEISNPGNFSLDAASQRVEPGMASNPRNPLIARVLYLRKAIEMWGRGIGLIINACEKAHLAPPRIYEDRGFVYTVFTRPTKQEWNAKVQGGNKAATENERTGLKTGLKTRLKTGLKDNSDTVDEALRQMIKDNPAITIPMMSEATRLSRNGVLYHLQALKENFGLTRVGGRKSGHWEFLK